MRRREKGVGGVEAKAGEQFAGPMQAARQSKRHIVSRRAEQAIVRRLLAAFPGHESTPAQQEAAFKFIKWVTQPERAASWGMAIG